MMFPKLSRIATLAAAGLALAFLAGPTPAQAQYPDKTITLIVPYGAGGGTDITARVLAKDLEPLTKQPVIVQNITGGGGWTGWGAIASAKPDGYTFGFLNAPSFYMGYLDPKLARKERLESFTPLINHVIDYVVFSVTPDSPYKTMKDLVEAGKKDPGKISITAHGVGNDEYLAITALEKLTGAKFRMVHNKGTPESKAQVLGKHVQVLGCNVSEITTEVKDKQLRVLGVMSPTRSKYLPDSPTLKEQGYNLEASVSRGIAGPAGLPKDIEAKMLGFIEKAVGSKEHQAKMNELTLELNVMKGAQYQKFLKTSEQEVKTLMGW
jgi:tripartite-type tricarboxylate transporter receptor subunit TctC